MNKISYEELIAFHPGYYIKEMIEDLAITQDELAKRLDTTGKTVSELLNGRINLTDEMALRLSIVFDTSVDMWLNLNKSYIYKKLEIERRRQEDAQCELVKMMDYKFWVELGLVAPVKKTTDKVRELQRYFKVSNLSVLKRRDFLVQYRTAITEVKDINVINANAWVQTAINMGREIIVEKFDSKKLKHLLPNIRNMTMQSPDIFIQELKEILASCGVALVIMPNLKNCGVNGAVKWLNKEKVILAVNDRRKFADIFWFSFFHEIGHVFQKRIAMLIVSDKNCDWIDEDKLMKKLEEDADSFAQDILISKREYEQFVCNQSFDEESIREFSIKINIHPGIVLGRLQKDNYVPYQTKLNVLKEKYKIIPYRE